jgi:hypothetical protein
VAVAELVGPGQRHVALVAAALLLGPVGLRVGLDHLRAGDLEDGRGRVPADGLGDRTVHAADLLGQQRAGQHGDLAGDPRLAVARLDHGPGERQSVDQVEPVGDERPRRRGMGLAGHRQLGHRVLAQRGSPVAAGGDHRVTIVARVTVDDRPLDREADLRHLGESTCPKGVRRQPQHLLRARLACRGGRLVGDCGKRHA